MRVRGLNCCLTVEHIINIPGSGSLLFDINFTVFDEQSTQRVVEEVLRCLLDVCDSIEGHIWKVSWRCFVGYLKASRGDNYYWLSYCIVLNKKITEEPLCAHCALPLCAFIVRFIVRAMGVLRQHSVHNGAPPSLHNEAAQCEIIVRPAWHNGQAYIGEAKSAWHNVFFIVRFVFDCCF